ncbi:MAG TPA: hypothetical protein VFH38_02070 [Jatrophihabitans sp.]|nr:hypothetical protein [Jatrophihabitans sp.]
MSTRTVLPSGPAALPAVPADRAPAGSRRVAIAATALIGLQAGLRAWIGYRGFFSLDDFAFTANAAQHSLFDPGYLLKPYNSHLMPGAFAEVWVLTKLWPLQFGVVATVDMLLQALVGFAFYRLLRALFGTRPAILVPLAVFLFTPITLDASTWWAAALNQLPQQLAMLAALLCQTRYLRTGRTRVGMLGALAVLAGLLFSEKTLLAVPLVVAFTLFWFVDGGIVHRLVQGWRRHWKVWLAYLAVAVPYAGYYAVSVPSPGGAVGTGGDTLQLYGTALGHTLLPGLLGGPWRWRQIGSAGALADPGQAAAWLSGAVVLAVVVATIVAHHRAWYGWAFGFGYAVLDIGVVAVSRATIVGPVVGNVCRYLTDAAGVAVLGAALAVLSPVGSWRHPPATLVRRPNPLRHLAATQLARDLRSLLPRPGSAAVVGTLVAAIVASSTVSTLRFDRFWSTNPARPYLQRLRADLAALPPSTRVYDATVPVGVVWPLLYPYNRLSRVLSPLPERPPFLHPGQSTAALAVPDASGRLRMAQVAGVGALPGPTAGGCGYLLGRTPVRIPLAAPTTAWSWVVRIGYIAGANAAATLHAGATTVQIAIHRGVHQIFVEADGAIRSVRITALSGDAEACTDDVTVGRVRPIPGTTP